MLIQAGFVSGALVCSSARKQRAAQAAASQHIVIPMTDTHGNSCNIKYYNLWG